MNNTYQGKKYAFRLQYRPVYIGDGLAYRVTVVFPELLSHLFFITSSGRKSKLLPFLLIFQMPNLEGRPFVAHKSNQTRIIRNRALFHELFH